MNFKRKKMDSPVILDTTLRDGEQAPGIIFTLNQRKTIAEMLVDCGIDEIEAGCPTMGESDIAFLKWCGKLKVPVSSWCRASLTDIGEARKTGLKNIHISLPVSDRLLEVFQKTRGWVEIQMIECSRICREDFETVTIGFMDASRTDPAYLSYLVELAGLIGYDRVRLADTAGVMIPSDVQKMFGHFDTEKSRIEFHPHNDLGMAGANGITALESGAEALSVTVLGIGERAGNAGLEETALALRVKNRSCRLDLPAVRALGLYVAKVTGRTIAPDKAVLGKNVFSHEAGIHAAATLKDPLSFMPVNPSEIGFGEPDIVTGRHSGSASIQYALNKSLLNVDRASAAKLLPFVRTRAEEYGRNLDLKELETLYYEHFDDTHDERTDKLRLM